MDPSKLLARARAQVKAGRVLSADNEAALSRAEELIAGARGDAGALGEAEGLLEQVLKQVDPSYTDDDSADEAADAPKAESGREVKTFPLAQVKTLDTPEEPGSFKAVVAVFGNVDSVGDRMDKGSFTRTLNERGLPPIVWSHNWDVPPIGAVKSAVETDEGLEITGRLFVGADEDHPVARQVYTAMKAKDGNGQSPLREFSFGYAVKQSTDETVDGKQIRVLKDVDLYEVGPTLVGANSATRLVGIKALAEELKLAASAAEKPTADNTDLTPPAPVADGQEARSRIGLWLTEHPRH